MPKGVYDRSQSRWQPRSRREYPAPIVELVERMYSDGKTTRQIQAALPPGYKAQRIIERHIDQRRRPGNPNQTASSNPHWRGNAVGYEGAHARVKRQRGSARRHLCVDCGSQAQDWSYIGGCPGELTERGLRYSPNISRYAARCVPCHRKFDSTARKAGKT